MPILVFCFIFLIDLTTQAASEAPTVIGDIRALYEEEIQVKNRVTLRFHWDEENPEYFGGSDLTMKSFSVTLGRYFENQPRLQAYILCHEVGHLLGGEPRKTTSTWASTEAQSDFFAASICLKKLLKLRPQVYSVKLESSEEFQILDEKCANLKTSENETQLCKQVGRIGYDMFTAIHKFMNVEGFAKPQFSSEPVEKDVGSRNTYPTLRCRMDTVLHGALCTDSQCTKPVCL